MGGTLYIVLIVSLKKQQIIAICLPSLSGLGGNKNGTVNRETKL